jgi:hypothetical protein
MMNALIFAVIGLMNPQATTGQAASSTPLVTVSGCVTQAERTGSLADDNRAGIAATPNTAPTDANSAEPVDAYLLTNASPMLPKADDPKLPRPTSYGLQGHERELSTHKGHRVEIVGRLLPSRESAASPTKPSAPGIERIAVQSVRMLSPQCPAKTP